MNKLKIWQEISGTLKSVKRINEEVVLRFSIDIKIKLPSADCINEILPDYIGDTIGILRTDSIDDPYKLKIIEKNGEKKNEKNKSGKNKRETATK